MTHAAKSMLAQHKLGAWITHKPPRNMTTRCPNYELTPAVGCTCKQYGVPKHSAATPEHSTSPTAAPLHTPTATAFGPHCLTEGSNSSSNTNRLNPAAKPCRPSAATRAEPWPTHAGWDSRAAMATNTGVLHVRPAAAVTSRLRVPSSNRRKPRHPNDSTTPAQGREEQHNRIHQHSKQSTPQVPYHALTACWI
jgi:hypothetical protein